MKIKVYVRNITRDEDFVINLPKTEVELIAALGYEGDEYIIIECYGIHGVSDYESVTELNKFIQECDNLGVDEKTLEILSATFLYKEIKEMIEKENLPTIIDFDTETSGWNFGNGGDFTKEFDKGMCLFDSGLYNPFSFEMNEDIYDWIDWESVWVNAETEGWRAVRANRTGYLIHR